MATKHLFTVLLFTTSLSILECRLMMAKSALSGMKSVSRVGMRHPFYTQDCKEGSIAKFLCTNEPIWLYNSTGGPGRECEVDETMNISQTAILLLRSHYENGMKKSIYLNGTFDQRDAKRMFLHIPGGQKGMRDHLTEDMLYLSQKLRCAVFKITLQNYGHVYDLLVRNSSIARGPSKGCKNAFAKLTSTSFRIYQPKCQDILFQSTEPEFTVGPKTPQNTHLR
ncbi:uncharacterized protein LOC119458301 isoform X7 [Dermacentor silvarum]|uniref:uncharacterized protein LOC119458301 isoform X7 n=1 Tax=Dermacentor silvarum TaxID=543639 RepID=UPI0021018E1F|nr:uncharacterized protein LOC119458301 isoform X7 [Dermacentor silvarum]